MDAWGRAGAGVGHAQTWLHRCMDMGASAHGHNVTRWMEALMSMATRKSVGRIQLRAVGGIPEATRAQGGACKVVVRRPEELSSGEATRWGYGSRTSARTPAPKTWHSSAIGDGWTMEVRPYPLSPELV
ncbi:hypothetical protein FZEAL_7026 [Fusarium zealandicum]|uniref:Uncharacterized protein n=1 Tax=Fusarium zealandicum TaxID=1053134 RepID=A0A8H4UGU5_9HYPO|nr:hypothetical protein FZEAL_7026 [Fusarium zealandicum]